MTALIDVPMHTKTSPYGFQFFYIFGNRGISLDHCKGNVYAFECKTKISQQLVHDSQNGFLRQEN